MSAQTRDMTAADQDREPATRFAPAAAAARARTAQRIAAPATTLWSRPWVRYAGFLGLVVVLLAVPALPHEPSPHPSWWLAAAGFVVAMVGAGVLGARRPMTHWLNTVAPLLVLPAIYSLRCADGNATSGFGALIFLPVIWFALYGTMRQVLLAVVAGTVTVVLPLVAVGAPEYPSSSWRGIAILVVLIAVLGPLIRLLVAESQQTNRALRRSEAELEATFENAPVGMAITGLRGDEQYRFLRVNRALCATFGRTAEELTSRPVEDFTHPDDLSMSRQLFANAADPATPRRISKRYLHKSGRTVWALVSYTVVSDDDGVPSHLISQIEDVSTRRESERALLDAVENDRVATERLAHLDRIRAELASTVSHELRTPLTSAAGYVELLLEGDAGPLTAEQRSMLDTVARNLTRLNGIVADVLSAAGAPLTAAAPATAQADIGDVVRAGVSSVALQAAARGQEIVSRNEVDGVLVDGDAGRLERLVVNLLSNALKFSPDDGVVTVDAHRREDEVVVSVGDEGIGISPENQARIFERFFRVSDDADAAPPGNGLGLSIVHAIATQYGGTVSVRSEVGTGSTFTVTLPVSRRTPSSR